MTARNAPTSTPEPTLIGCSSAVERLRAAAARVAAGQAKVLITGESGVGKDLLARLIHARSSRAERPFVAINCAGVSETLLESELFGHVKGSFTGAYRDKAGLFQLGDKGTVFLDEIGEMSLRMQAMLLRFLENGEIKPVGSDVVCSKVDVRIIAATNRNLPDMVARGLFREDLLYRIMVFQLEVPPLRERREDIRPLIAHLAAKHNTQVSIDEEALAVMERYHWPGNVRELQNIVEQLAWLGTGTAGVKDLPPTLLAAANGTMRLGRERRRRVCDQLYEALTGGSCSFWEHVYPMFINRDLTRADLTALVAKALAATAGNYRAVLPLLGMEASDYKRFLNLLSTHGCTVDFREFRGKSPLANGKAERPNKRSVSLPMFPDRPGEARVAS